MEQLHCAACQKPISATHKICPHCGQKITLWREVKNSIEKTRFGLAIAVIITILLLGMGWFLRMDSGARWPLYAIVILAAPLIPWFLQQAYKRASPLPEEEENTSDKHS